MFLGDVIPRTEQVARGIIVEHDQRVGARVRRDARERVLAGLGEVDLVSLGFQVEAQPVREVGFVLDDEDAAHDPVPAAAVGSCTVKVVPWPGPSLSANTVPPWRATTARTMKRPRPAPLMRVVIVPGMR